MEQELERRFPGMTIEQICNLAELGKSVAKVSEHGYVTTSLLYIVGEVLRSDSDLACRTRYCMKDLIDLVLCISEYMRR